MATEIRQNFKALGKPGWLRFTNAVIEMLDPDDNADPELYSIFPQWHKEQSSSIHNHISFLAWHRAFIRLFELELKKADVRLGKDGSITLPYWDWTVDRSGSSSLWSEDFMGPAGSLAVTFGGPATTVNNGPFKYSDWELYMDPHSGPLGHTGTRYPLTRVFGAVSLGTDAQMQRVLKSKIFDTPPFTETSLEASNQLSAATTAVGTTITVDSTAGFAAGETVHIGSTPEIKVIKTVTSETVLTLTTAVGAVVASGEPVVGQRAPDLEYLSFRNHLELVLHNPGHGWVGGLMGLTSTSPIDPVFFLHHANVDRLWAKWQAKNPKKAMQYISDAGIIAGGNSNSLKLNDPLIPTSFTPSSGSGLTIPPAWKTITTEHVLNWQDLGHASLKSGTDSYKYDDDPVKPMSFN
jgi:hypothetical protein